MVLLKYRYENLKDYVAADEVPAYLSEWETAEKGMAFNLSDNVEGKPLVASGASPDRNTGFVVSYIILGVCVLVTFLYRRTARRNFWE